MGYKPEIVNPGGGPLTGTANEAITAGMFLALVAPTGSEDFRLKIADTAASDIIVGVAVKDAASGAADLLWQPIGIVIEVTAGDTVTLGAAVTCESGGLAVVTTTVGDYLGGVALKAATDGQAFPILCVGHARFAATS